MRNPRIKAMTTILLLLGAILLKTMAVHAAAFTARVESSQGATGDSVVIPISVAGSPGTVAMHIELVYDPAILQVESVQPGPLLAGNALLESNTEENGRLVIGFAATDQVVGEGGLAEVTLNVIGSEGQTSPLILQNCRAWDEEGVDILINTESGEFLVSKAGISNQVYIFLAIMCCLIIMGAALTITLFVYFRRQRW